jgi:hypothetical protein
MDTVDYVIMGVGGALIVIGLYLYISGKKEKESASNLEGFGIKLNVSNPSILLIVVGVLLLLVPRFFPKGPPSHVEPAHINPVVPVDIVSQPESIQRLKGKDTSASADIERVTKPSKYPPVQGAFLPAGTWQPNSYSENGVDLSANVSGTMNFTSQNIMSVQWNSNFVSQDLWGNVYDYSYQGQITNQNNIYTLNISASNDPSFIRQAPVPLELLQENGGILHMRYVYQGTEILLHWQQY